MSPHMNAETKLNPNVEEFRPSRPKRATVAVAKVKIRDIQQEDYDIRSLIKWGEYCVQIEEMQ